MGEAQAMKNFADIVAIIFMLSAIAFISSGDTATATDMVCRAIYMKTIKRDIE